MTDEDYRNTIDAEAVARAKNRPWPNLSRVRVRIAAGSPAHTKEEGHTSETDRAHQWREDHAFVDPISEAADPEPPVFVPHPQQVDSEADVDAADTTGETIAQRLNEDRKREGQDDGGLNTDGPTEGDATA